MNKLDDHSFDDYYKENLALLKSVSKVLSPRLEAHKVYTRLGY